MKKMSLSVFFCLAFCVLLTSCQKKIVKVACCALPNGESITLLARQSNVERLTSGDYRFFFSEQDMQKIYVAQKHFPLSFVLMVEQFSKKNSTAELSLQLLYDNSPDASKSDALPRLSVYHATVKMALGMQLQRDQAPSAIAVHVGEKTELAITALDCIVARCGWDFSAEHCAVYASTKGGVFDMHKPETFPSFAVHKNEKLIISVQGTTAPLVFNSTEDLCKTILSAGINDILLYDVPHSYSTEIPYELLESSAIHYVDHSRVQALYSQFVDPTQILIADPAVLVNLKKTAWGKNSEFKYIRWDKFPDVLLFDFANHDIQDKMLKRLAFFVEKKGFAGKLWSDQDIKYLHGFNAYDFKADDLAAFFSMAQKTKFPLHFEELALQELLVRERIIVKNEKAFSAGCGAIVSISQETGELLRKKLLTHEAFHGMYFATPEFREYTKKVYTDMPDEAQQFLKTYFAKNYSLSYDTNNQYLVENEFMAYLLQQPFSAVTGYIKWNMAGYIRRRLQEPAVLSYIEQTKGIDFKKAARALNEFVYTKTGLCGGRVWSLDFRSGIDKHPLPLQN